MNGRRLCLKLPQLKTLVESKETCVVVRPDFPRTLVLSPGHLESLKDSVRDRLDSRLAKYDSELEGIVLSYRNVKVLNDVAPIQEDCKFGVDITADFYVFQPQVGSILKGVVHEKTQNHIGCLVHSIFNISIPRVGKLWYGDRVSIGDEISFSVDLVNFRRALPYIRGKLVKQETQEDMEESPELDSNESEETIRVKQEPEDHSKSLCRKKKKKDSYREEVSEEKALKSCLKRKRSDSESLTDSLPKKKRSKDVKDSLIESLMIKKEIEIGSPSYRMSSDSESFSASKKKKKKSKSLGADEITSSLRKEILDTNGCDTPSSPKKKKKKSKSVEDCLEESPTIKMEIGSPAYRQSSDSERNPGSKKKKKKSKSLGSELDETTSNMMKEAIDTNGCGTSSSTKKKKSKRSSSPPPEPSPSIEGEVRKKKHKRKTLEGIS